MSGQSNKHARNWFKCGNHVLVVLFNYLRQKDMLAARYTHDVGFMVIDCGRKTFHCSLSSKEQQVGQVAIKGWDICTLGDKRATLGLKVHKPGIEALRVWRR